MNLENIKIKYIKEDEFLSYIDWLTRFKNPIDNLLRVCEKVITKNLIYPKLSSKKVQELDIFEEVELTQYIWNLSLENLLGKIPFNNTKLKDFLIFEENKTFDTKLLTENIKLLSKDNESLCNDNYFNLRNKLFLQIDELVEYFEKENKDNVFLQRLIQKRNSSLPNEKLFTSICDYSSIKLLFLVEGITEEKLFPTFSNIYGTNFSKAGIKLKAAGGKTQILKYYAQVRKLLKIPVFILLDADGKDIINELNNILEKKDTVYLISKGEIEDILPHSLITKAINNYYSMEATISENDLNKNEPMTQILYNLYREKGFGEFHKAKFAQILQENITSSEDIEGEIKEILSKLTDLI